jgi:hypothetical protein
MGGMQKRNGAGTGLTAVLETRPAAPAFLGSRRVDRRQR